MFLHGRVVVVVVAAAAGFDADVDDDDDTVVKGTTLAFFCWESGQ